MRILHLISSSGLFGAERVVIELSGELKRRDHHPIVGLVENSRNSHREIAAEARAGGIEFAAFPCRGRFDLGLLSSMKEFIKQRDIEIVHCHGYKSNFYGLLASRKRIPIVTTNHNWLKSHWRLRLYNRLDAAWIRYFDGIVAVSEGVKADMLGYRVPEEKIRVIDNGIDPGRFKRAIPRETVRRGLGLNGEARVIGTVGNLGQEKGHKYLLDAVRGVLQDSGKVKLLIVGDGPLRARLEGEAGRLGVDGDVIFAGYRSDIPELLSVMDIFVLPSLKEGLPMVLLEAMAAKVPVVSTRVGSVPKVIRHGLSGILVEPADGEALAGAISLLMGDPDKARQYAEAGYMELREKYSSAVMAEHYIGLYRSLLEH